LAAANDPVPPAQPDATAAVAAMAVAAVETPRRTAQRRAARTLSRAAAGRRAPMLAAAAGTPRATTLATDAHALATSSPMPPAAITLATEDSAPSIAFPGPRAASRPSRRALRAPQGAFTVASGSLLPREPRFEPRLPGGRMPPWPAPTPAEPQADAAQP